MATTNETGHVRNLANFNRLIDLCTLFSSRYNPSNPNLQLSALQRQYQQTQQLFADFTNTKTSYQTIVIARQDAFQQAETLPTRILSVLKSNQTNPKVVKIAQNLTKKIRGQRIGKLKEEEEEETKTTKKQDTATDKTEKTSPENPTKSENLTTQTENPNPENRTAQTEKTSPENLTAQTENSENRTANSEKSKTEKTTEKTTKTRSVSQRSYDQRVSHFSQLFSVVQSTPTYLTNEADLQLSTLQNTVDNLLRFNQSISNSEYQLQHQRTLRNEALYTSGTGITDVAAMVKEYVKSVFGTKSAEYKSVAALKFIRS